MLLDESLTERCKRLQHYETDPWAPRAILRHELLTPRVIDCCCGTGIMGRAAEEAGYEVFYSDIHDWGHKPTYICDWLNPDQYVADPAKGATIFINPPFSEAVDFVKHAIDLGARKIVFFERFSWWKSQDRRAFWEAHPPARVYVCGNRAHCWRHDITPERAERSGTTTAYAFFVWEQGQPRGTQLSHIWRADA